MTQLQIHTLDLPTFVNQIHRQTIGFDNLFDQLNRTFANSKTDGNYPPHNVVKLDDTHYVIEVAVAGFAENEIDVELKRSSSFCNLDSFFLSFTVLVEFASVGLFV